jgi:Cu/Ag efflux protein CusF
MKVLTMTLAVAIASVFAFPVSSQTGQVIGGTAPGSAMVGQTVDVTATITAIDPATRAVTLKGPQGNDVVITAGPDVSNFDQMKVGDNVDVQYVEALTLELKKGGGQAVSRTEEVVGGGAKPGERPAGGAARQIRIIADVLNVDTQNQIVTLRGPQRTVDLKVKDPSQLAMIAKGDQVEAIFTEAVAVSVRPAAKK